MSLLDNVKIMLDKTADDTSEDEKIKIIIADGKQRLLSVHPLLTDEDFENPTLARYLLFSFCRYAYSNAAEMFDINYKADLLTLRQKYEVAEYENQNTD